MELGGGISRGAGVYMLQGKGCEKIKRKSVFFFEDVEIKLN